MNTLLQDLRYAVRMFAKSPAFTAIAVLALALGIGANTAIFSLIDGILMRALPVRDAQSLVVLRWSALHQPEIHQWSEGGDCSETEARGESSSCSFSEPFFHDVASHIDSFSDVAAFSSGGGLNLTGIGHVRVLSAEAISGNFFPMLGVRPAAGRLILPSDDEASASAVLVLNYGYCQSEFGGSLSVIGKTVRVNDVPFTIIGVANPQFDSLSPGEVRDIWIPLSVLPRLRSDDWAKAREADVYSWWLVIIGRLKSGVSRLQAQTAVSTLFRNEMLHVGKPLSRAADDPRVAALPAQSTLTGSKTRYSTQLYVLMIAVGIILLIACANVAGLLLSRAAARQKEIAVRLALGAGPRRIVRQLLTESVLLALVGGGLGILFALWGTQTIVSLMAGGSAHAFGFSPGIDGRVLASTLLVAVLTGIAFGLAPAVRGTRVDLTPALKESSGGSAERRRLGKWLSLGDSLVIAQVALAIVVLVGAGLLVRTLQNLKDINPGFDTRNLLTFGVNPALIGYKAPQMNEFYGNLQQRVAALPGVESVSYASTALLAGNLSGTSVHVRGTPQDQMAETNTLEIGPNYFSTMRMRLLAGRGFTPADFTERQAEEYAAEAKKAGTAAPSTGTAKPAAKSTLPPEEQPVPAIVNKAFVTKYLAGKNPLGQRLDDPAEIVVGVISDAKYSDLRSAIGPTMYTPSNGSFASFEVRTRVNPASLAATIRSIVTQMDSNLTISDVHTETQLIEQLLVRERMIAQLSGFFGLLALALACIGLYGLLSFEVTRRTREIGIRVALGAQGGDVLRMVVKQGIVLAFIGVAVGISATLAVTRYLNPFYTACMPAIPQRLSRWQSCWCSWRSLPATSPRGAQ
jgi:predicted permease